MHSHSHSHSHDHEHTNGNGNDNGAQTRRRGLDPKERLSRLFLLLEAQFGGDAITPISIPPVPSTGDDDEDEAAQEKEMQKVLERLHNIGIPVPGVEIKLAEGVGAKVWLEDLRVECANAIWRGRVENVVREAVEGVAPLWG